MTKKEKNEEYYKGVWHRRRISYCKNPDCRKRLSIYNPNCYCFACAPQWVVLELRPKRYYSVYVKRECKIKGCGRNYYAKDYCIKHYHIYRINGKHDNGKMGYRKR